MSFRDAGIPDAAFGVTNSQPERGTVPGVVIAPKEQLAMAKAEADGVYTLNGGRFKVRKGDPIPDGAEFTALAADEEPKAEERAKPAAPENRAKAEKPENR